jgi:hypothetical protein
VDELLSNCVLIARRLPSVGSLYPTRHVTTNFEMSQSG